MKKFSGFAGIFLSMVMIFTVGSTTVLAAPGDGVLSIPEEDNEAVSMENEVGLESQNDQTEDAEKPEENGPEDDSETDIGLEENLESQEDVEMDENTEETDPEADAEKDLEETEIQALSIDYSDEFDELELSYDDRFDLSALGIPDNVEIYKTEYEDGEGITSYQVSKGEKQDDLDTDLLTQKEGGSTEVIATAVGSGTVWLVDEDKVDALDEALSEEETQNTNDPQTDENTDNSEPIEVYQIKVTVEPATLTLMFLAGQSNMEGYCDSIMGYDLNASVACKEGTVYSTYAPSSSDRGKNIAGISVAGTTDNAAEFVAGSLQGEMNISGGTLPYPLNALTSEGNGKTGPDSGLAYEWNQLTGDKVWVVNTAYGATNISEWISGGSCYERSVAIWNYVKQTFEAEKAAGHYLEGDRLAFWQQGETSDSYSLSAEKYESSFAGMYSNFKQELGLTGFGIIMVRAGYATERGDDYKTDKDLQMTGPRIAQYWLGSGESKNYSDDVFVVSNANEQWVSASGVTSYFKNAYPDGTLSYPMHNHSNALPTSVDEVHSDIHYSQIGHNENGITAANGMHEALYGSSAPTSLSWKDGDGKSASSVTLDYVDDTTILVGVPEPVYYGKSVTYSTGNSASYDASTGTVTGTKKGTSNITASANGSTVGNIAVTVETEKDLSSVLGNVTGVYKYDGTWYYVVNGIVQSGYEGVQKNSNGWWYINNGKVDFTYNGFAQNSNGWWYIENGKVTFNKNGVLKDTNKKVDGTDGWWYVVGSKVQFDYTDKVANYKNDNGWWYIKNGKVDFSANTVAKNNNGWWYVEGGKVIFSYNGFGSNSNGKWYCENGKVTFSKNSVIKDTTGAIGTKGTWWYVVGSKVQTSFTGLANYKNSNGWWYIKNGQVDFSHNGVDKNVNGWYYVTDGKVQFGFTGLANYKNSNGWWYIKGGKVDFSYKGLAKNKNGWYYLEGGKVIFSYNGFASNSNGKWYVDNGKVTFDKNSVLKDTTGAIGTKGTWYYVVGSKVQTGFTGLANYKNSNGWWYIKNGKVDFTHNGVDKNKNGWWYVKGGKVIFSYNGIAQNSNGWWYIKNGKVDFSYNGTVKSSGVTYKVTNGKVAR